MALGNCTFFFCPLATTAPPTTVQVLPPSVAARKKSMSPWVIAVLAAIGGLVFLVFICAIIHCCVLRKRKVKKRGIQKWSVWRYSYWSKRPNISVSTIKKCMHYKMLGEWKTSASMMYFWQPSIVRVNFVNNSSLSLLLLLHLNGKQYFQLILSRF